MINPMWFTNYQDWVRYVNKYMMNAEKKKGLHQIILKNDTGQVIASWQQGAKSGQVYENRTKKRLERDIDKLK